MLNRRWQPRRFLLPLWPAAAPPPAPPPADQPHNPTEFRKISQLLKFFVANGIKQIYMCLWFVYLSECSAWGGS